jgi:Fe-S oxidoreductase
MTPIAYRTGEKSGQVYAYQSESYRDPETGKVKTRQKYLGILDKGASLNDIVGLCPSCHRSIHIHYPKWLKGTGQEDFNSNAEAIDVYLSAIKDIAQ